MTTGAAYGGGIYMSKNICTASNYARMSQSAYYDGSKTETDSQQNQETQKADVTANINRRFTKSMEASKCALSDVTRTLRVIAVVELIPRTHYNKAGDFDIIVASD